MIRTFYKQFVGGFLQTFDDQKKVREVERKDLVLSRPIKYLAENKDKVHEMNREGAGIFFTPNPIQGRRTEKNVTAIRWVYVDMDEGTKEDMMELIKKSPIYPNFIVESSRSYHLYWRVDSDRKQFSRIINGLLKFYDGDTAISSINEVLRLPGFYHMKDPKNPFLIKVIYENMSSKQTAEEMIEAYPYLPPMIEFAQRHKLSDKDLALIKNIPIIDILRKLGVELTSDNFVVENGEKSSASINVKENYVHRFSGKPGSGSTIDAVMQYGKKSLPEAIEYLKEYAGINNIIKPKDVAKAILSASKPAIELDFSQRAVFTWGTKQLDEKIAPKSTDSYTLLAGETGSGKTTFAFFTAMRNALLGNKVLFLTLEMSREAMIIRNARDFAGITKDEWRDRRKISKEKKKTMKERKAYLENIEGLSIEGVPNAPTALIFELIKQHDPDLVFIDNFDLIEKEGSGNGYVEETRIANEFMNFARDEFSGAIVILHHLNTKKNRDKNALDIGALRGSQKIIHNAGLYLCGYRSTKVDEDDKDEVLTKKQLSSFSIVTPKDREFGKKTLATTYFQWGEFVDEFKVAKPLIIEEEPKKYEQKEWWNV